jgi:hypothetical protein
MAASLTTAGYWNLLNLSKELNIPVIGEPQYSQNLAYTPFVPGNYTVAVGDEWGQAVILHVTVVSASSSPVEVVSVVGPIPPYTPAGAVVGVTLKNVGSTPITSLAASLQLPRAGQNAPFSFAFNVNSSKPLLPGRSTQDSLTLFNAGFSGSVYYPLTIGGTYSNGTQFSYSVQVQIVPPA